MSLSIIALPWNEQSTVIISEKRGTEALRALSLAALDMRPRHRPRGEVNLTKGFGILLMREDFT